MSYTRNFQSAIKGIQWRKQNFISIFSSSVYNESLGSKNFHRSNFFYKGVSLCLFFCNTCSWKNNIRKGNNNKFQKDLIQEYICMQVASCNFLLRIQVLSPQTEEDDWQNLRNMHTQVIIMYNGRYVSPNRVCYICYRIVYWTWQQNRMRLYSLSCSFFVSGQSTHSHSFLLLF